MDDTPSPLQPKNLDDARRALSIAQYGIQQKDFRTALSCCDAVVSWLEKTPRNLWVDDYYRLSTRAHIGFIPYYGGQGDQKSLQDAYNIVIADGERIKEKTQEDWRLMFEACRNLSVCYFNEDPKNVKGFRLLGNRMVEIAQALNPKTLDDLYALVDTYHNWGLLTGDELCLNRADQYRGEILKHLWKTFRAQHANQELDEAKKSFVKLSDLIDEISYADRLRQIDVEIEEILKLYLSFGRSVFAQQVPFVLTENLKQLERVFSGAKKAGSLEVAKLVYVRIAKELAIDLTSPYDAVGCSASAIEIVIGMLCTLGQFYFDAKMPDAAVEMFTKAEKFVRMLQNVPDEVWRRCAMGLYCCANVRHGEKDLRLVLRDCQRAIEMFERIQSKTSLDDDCIAKSSLTLMRLQKGAARPASKTPPDSLASRQKSFNRACKNNDVMLATHCLRWMGEYLNIDVFTPTPESSPPDDSIQECIDYLRELAVLNFNLKKDIDEELRLYILALTWWTKLQEKSVYDWRVNLAIQQMVSEIHMEKNNSADFFATTEHIFKAYEHIANANASDVMVLVDACSNAAQYCLKMGNTQQSREWHHKADYYRRQGISHLKSVLVVLEANCNKAFQGREWDSAAVQGCASDAVLSFTRLTELASHLLQKDAELGFWMDAQAYVFAFFLYRVFRRHGERSLLEHVREWLGKIQCVSDDSEWLRIECDVQEKAFCIQDTRKIKRNSALELARAAMSEEDKQKKKEIDARKKIKEDEEKARRDHGHRDKKVQKSQSKEVLCSEEVKKEAKNPEAKSCAVITRAMGSPVFFKMPIVLSNKPNEQSCFLVNQCKTLLLGLLQPELSDAFTIFAKKFRLGDLCIALYQLCPSLEEIKENKDHELYLLLQFLERCCDEPSDANVDFCIQRPENYVEKIFQLLLSELDKRLEVCDRPTNGHH